ncbi:MAG: prepilin peptidase [Wujia sp.]
MEYVLSFVLLLAVIFDFRTDKIPNWLCFATNIYGMTFRLIVYGYNGVADSLIGMVVPFICLFVLFVIHALGAGDIKLLCAVGACIGREIRETLFWFCVCAGMACLVRILSAVICQNEKLEKSRQYDNWRNCRRMHMAVCIFTAWLITWMRRG